MNSPPGGSSCGELSGAKWSGWSLRNGTQSSVEPIESLEQVANHLELAKTHTADEPSERFSALGLRPPLARGQPGHLLPPVFCCLLPSACCPSPAACSLSARKPSCVMLQFVVELLRRLLSPAQSQLRRPEEQKWQKRPAAKLLSDKTNDLG